MRYDEPLDLLGVMVQNLYNAETQLILALPRVALRADHPTLRSGLESHLAETRTHAARLEAIADTLGIPCMGRKCMAMEGLLKDGEELMGAGGDPALVDAAIIGACECVEHYEMAAYDAAIAQAQISGRPEIREQLRMTRQEEERAAQTLAEVVPQLRTMETA